MKKTLSILLAAALTAGLLAVPVSAEGEHVHQWSKEWSYDTVAHWHECTAPDCPITDNTQKDGYGEHTGEWLVQREGSERSSGLRVQTCPACNHFIYDLTPAALPTADSYTLDLRKGPVTLTGDEKDALMTTLSNLPGVRLDDIHLQGPPEGYYVTLGNRSGYDLTIRYTYAPSGPDERPDQVASITCTAAPTSGSSFTGQVPADTLAKRLEQGSPIFASLSVLLPDPLDRLADGKGHWAEDSIRAAVSGGWVNGYPDGTFRPDRTISRAEMGKLLLAAARIDQNHYCPSQMGYYADPKPGAFADMASNWLTTQGWTEPALALGMLRPAEYDGGAFAPDRAITRGEIAVLSVRLLGLDAPAAQDSGESAFTDRETFAPDQAGYIREAAAAGIVTGYPDGTFGPDRIATRAEAVAMAARVRSQMDRGWWQDLPAGERVSVKLAFPGQEYLSGWAVDYQIVDNVLYVSLVRLADAIKDGMPGDRHPGKAWSWDPLSQSMTIPLSGGGAVTYRAGDRTAYAGETPAETLPAPVRLTFGHLMLPVCDLSSGAVYGPWEAWWNGTSRTLGIVADWPAADRS